MFKLITTLADYLINLSFEYDQLLSILSKTQFFLPKMALVPQLTEEGEGGLRLCGVHHPKVPLMTYVRVPSLQYSDRIYFRM